MAFFEELFPVKVSINAQAGPMFDSSVAESGGRRVVNLNDPYPTQMYSISQPVKESAEFEAVRNFFYVVGGNVDGFRLKDWSDYRLVQGNNTLQLLTGSIWQILRTYTYGPRTLARAIYKVSGSSFGDPDLLVYRTRSAVRTALANPADYTVDLNTGQVTINGHVSGDTYDCEGVFHVPVSFVDPRAIWTYLGTSRGLTEWSGIELKEFQPL